MMMMMKRSLTDLFLATVDVPRESTVTVDGTLQTDMQQTVGTLFECQRAVNAQVVTIALVLMTVR